MICGTSLDQSETETHRVLVHVADELRQDGVLLGPLFEAGEVLEQRDTLVHVPRPRPRPRHALRHALVLGLDKVGADALLKLSQRRCSFIVIVTGSYWGVFESLKV